MQRIRRAWSTAAWCVACAACTAALAGGIDLVRDEDSAPAITWKADAAASITHNLEQWKSQLASQVKDESLRSRAMAARELALHEAILTKFARDQAARRTSAVRAAELWMELAPRSDEAAAALRRVIDLSPGDVDAAAAALLTLGRQAGDDRLASLEYAYQRMQALARLGLIARDDERLEVLADELQGEYLRRGWLHPARAMWEARPAGSREEQVAAGYREGELLWAAGDGSGAIRRMREAMDLTDERSRWGQRVKDRLRAYNNAYVASSPPMYMTAPGLTAKLETATDADAPAVAASLDAAFAADPYAAALVRVDHHRHAAAWPLLAARVAELPAAARNALGQLQQQAVDLAPDDPDGQTALRLFRRYPMNAALQRAMLDRGERDLWSGRAHAALRAFEDVMAWTGDTDLRARATVGRWAALAALGDPDLEAAMKTTPDAAPLPWRGGTAPAERVKQQLRTPPPPKAPVTAGGQISVLKSPPWPWWPQNFAAMAAEEAAASFTQLGAGVVGGGEGVWLTSPGVLAGYAPGSSQPAWSLPLASIPAAARETGREATVPGLFEPALQDGVLFTRCGTSADGARLSDVAAVDGRTGALQWTTATNPAWRTRWPISDPVVADGRVYVLVLTYLDGRRALLVPVGLVCLDAATGRELWHRTLALQSVEVLMSTRLRREDVRAADLSHYGTKVRVHRGAVYCSTNMGMIARLDARDGLIEWVRHYDRITLGSQWARVFRRVGGQPVVTGDRLIVAPRDYPGILAVDRGSGELLWAQRDLPSQRMLGLAAGLVLTCDDAHVAGVDPADGAIVWARRIEGGLLQLPQLSGDRLYVAGGGEAMVLDAASGAVAASLSGLPQELAGWGVSDGRVWAVSSAPADTTAPARLLPAAQSLRAASSGTPGLPLQLTWSLNRSRPFLLPASAYRADDPRWAVRSDNLLDVIDLREAQPWRWQRRIDPGLEHVVWGRDVLVLVYSDRVVVAEAGDGRLRGAWPLPHAVKRTDIAGHSLLIRDDSSAMTVVDLDTGRLAWSRDWTGYEGFKLDQASVAGRELVLVGQNRGKRRMALFADLADGRILRRTEHYEKVLNGTALTQLVGRELVGLTKSGKLYRLALDDGKVAEFKAKSTSDFSHNRVVLEVMPPWVQVRRHRQTSRSADFEHWLYRLDDLGYVSHFSNDSKPMGDHLATVSRDKLTITNLRTRKATGTFNLPTASGRSPSVLSLRSVPDGWVAVVGMIGSDRSWPQWLRVVRYGGGGGDPVADQMLDATECWSSAMGAERVNWAGAALLVAHPAGLDVYAPGQPPADGGALQLTGLEKAVVIDGRADDWPEARVRPDHAEDGATLQLAWQEWTLTGCVTVPADSPRTWPGGGEVSTGDRLVIAMTADGGTPLRLALGVDEQGRFAASEVVPGAVSAIHHDPVTRRLTYEFALPVQTYRIRRGDGVEGIRLSLEARRDGQTLLRLGQGIAGADVVRLKHRMLLRP